MRNNPARTARYLIALALGLTVPALPVVAQVGKPSGPTTSSDRAGTAFNQLGTLLGKWRVADRDDHPLRIRFYLTSGGNTVVESWEVGDRVHSLTLYHRDGDDLLATHYCPQGNQPRMRFIPSDDGKLRFSFHDATDLDLESEQYQHDLWFDWSIEGLLNRGEIYKDGEGTEHPSQLVLVRTSK